MTVTVTMTFMVYIVPNIENMGESRGIGEQPHVKEEKKQEMEKERKQNHRETPEVTGPGGGSGRRAKPSDIQWRR